MCTPYKRIGITCRSAIEEKELLIPRIIAIIEKEGATAFLDRERCDDGNHQIFDENTAIDALIVLGGDGTILRCIREKVGVSCPLITINRGTVGFLAEMTVDDIDDALPKMLRGEGIRDERQLLSVVVRRDHEIVATGDVLNEAVISQGAIARLIDLSTMVGTEPLTTFHADGVIIATPTGSTAYSLAAGGPIVHPDLRATIVTPINPHSFSQKPLVLPSSDVITVRIDTKRNSFGDAQVSLTLDGQRYIALESRDLVEVQTAERTVQFLRRKRQTFLRTLRTKLQWGGPERIDDRGV